MTVTGCYSISHVNLQIECEDERLTEKVISAIDDCFFTSNHDGSFSDSPNITLRFKNNDFSIKALKVAHELYASSSLRVLKDGDFCYLISGDSVFELDIRNGSGIGLIDPSFWESPLKKRQDFLILSLLWLLRTHGLYALHANGLVKDGVGILIAGSSGSGKSTTAFSLIRQGCKYLSDDVVLIREKPEGIEAIAFQKGFSFDPNLTTRFTELNGHLEKSPYNGRKRFLDIAHIYPDKFQSECYPKILLFPKIMSHHRSELIPIDRAKALVLLAENSGGIMVDREMIVKQMEVLKRLVYQASSYQLLAGHDLYEEPERISEIVSEI